MKKILTKEALALLNGKAEDGNSAKLTEAELAEQAAAVKVAEEAAKVLADAKLVEDEDEGEATLQEEFEAFKVSSEEAAVKLQEEIDALKTSAKESVTSFAEQTDNLKSIVSGHVSQMRIAVGLVAVDMTDLTVERLLTEYNSSMVAFEKLPIGGVVPVPEVKAEETQTSSIDLAAADATGLN